MLCTAQVLRHLDLSNISAYDQGCNEEFQKAMKNYFEGKATKDEALESILQRCYREISRAYLLNFCYT